MSTIKISELASKLSLTTSDLLAIADNSGVAFKGTLSDLQTFLNTIGVSGYKGVIASSDPSPSEDGFFLCSDSGVYTNFGGTVVDLTNGLSFISVESSQSVFKQSVLPIYPIEDSPTVGSLNLATSGGIANQTESLAVSELRQFNPNLTFIGFVGLLETAPSPTLNDTYICTLDGITFAKDVLRGQILVGNGTGFDLLDLDIQEQFRLGLEFYYGLNIVSFPNPNEIQFDGTTQLYSKIQGKFIRVVPTSTPINYVLDDQEFLVFNPTKPFTVVTSGHNYVMEDAIYKVGLTSFDPKTEIKLLYQNNDVGIVEGIGLMAAHYHQQITNSSILRIEEFYKPLEYSALNNISYPTLEKISFDGQTTIYSQLNKKYLRIKATGDIYPVEFTLGDSEFLVFTPDFTKSFTGDGVNYVLQDSLTIVTQTNYDPTIHVPLLFRTDDAGISPNIGLLGGHYSYNNLKNRLDEVDNVLVTDIYSTPVEQSLEWVKDEMYVLDEGDTNHTTYGDITVVDKYGVSEGVKYTHNLGHANNFSYLENIDKGLTGNHDGSALTLAKLLIVPDVSTPPANILEYSACVEIVFNDGVSGLLGDITASQFDACWYDYTGDYMIMGWYSSRDDRNTFAKTHLGRGTNDLSGETNGYGSYSAVAAGEFNGTADILQIYENLSFTFNVGGNMPGDMIVQGLTYHKDRLYVGAGNSNSVVFELFLNEDNNTNGFNSTFKKTKIISAGRTTEAEGVSIKDNILYMGMASEGVYTYSLNGVDSGIGRIGDTVPYHFKNRGKTRITISPLKVGGLITTDLGVDSQTEDDFVVISTSKGGVGEYYFTWMCNSN